MRRTKRDLPYATQGGLRFTIPAGSLVEPAVGQPGVYWVTPAAFPRNSIERHDATYYGVSVAESDTEIVDYADKSEEAEEDAS